MILSICNNTSVLQILYIIKLIIRIICIIVPIILIISLSIDVTKSVISADINESLKKIVPKIVASIIIFFIPTFVNIISNIFSTNEYINCLNSATEEGIKQSRYNEANSYIEKAYDTLNSGDLKIAESKINKIKDESQRQELLNKIKEAEEKIKKIEEILNYSASSITQKEYDEALEFANSLPDCEAKNKLLNKLETLKKVLTPVITVGGSTGKALSGNNIVTVLENNGSSVEELNNKIKRAVESAGVGTREAAVAAAATLINTLSGYGYKINYEWWGKYANLGIDTRWGSVLSSSQYSRDCNDYAKKYNNDGSNCWNNMKWYGLDCSGFSQWIVIQAMQDKTATYKGGTKHLMNSNTNYAQCQMGDPIYKTGHVAMIVGLDDENKSYIIAESSSGVTYNTVKYTNSSWWCNHITIYSD